MIKKYFKKVNKSRGFTRLVDLGDAILSRTKSASPKLTTGFTLVETLIAVSIFSFSILALMAVLSQGISDTGYAKKKMIAGYLAQEGIEYIRNMRDTYVLYTEVPGNSWDGFRSKLASCNPTNGCRFDTVFPHDVSICNSPNDCKLYVNNGNYSTDPTSGDDSGFTRKIWMDVIDSNKELKISSEVRWTQRSGTYNITFTENLFNWVE